MKEFIKYVKKLQLATQKYIEYPSPSNYETLQEISEIVSFIAKFQEDEINKAVSDILPEIILN